MLAAALVRLKSLLFRHRIDAELDEELRFHLEREIERNVAKGMSPSDAESAARRAFGNTTVVTEQARDAWRWQWMEELRQDVRFAARTCRRAPAYAIAVVATIGLGLGLLTTAFTVFNAYVLRPLPVRQPKALYEAIPYATDRGNHAFTWPQFHALRARGDIVDDAFAYVYHPTRLRGAIALGVLVSGNYFDMLGVPPALGRTFVAADAEPPRGNDVVVLSHTLWTSVFGGDSSVVGTRVSLRGVPMTVIGIAREGFGGLGSVPVDFWAPLTAIATLGAGPDPFDPRAPEALRVVTRLRADRTLEQTGGAFATWLRETTSDRKASERIEGAVFTARGTSLPANREIYQLFAPIGFAFAFVMLIACANVANLTLARGLSRQREIGIRLALGAGRGRLIRQLLTESALLSVPAALLGFAVSRVALDVGVRVIFATVPPAYTEYLRVISLGADARLAVFMLLAAVASALAFGLAPAIRTTRARIVEMSRGDFDTELRPSRLRNGLVVVQITFSVILLISAGVLLSSARQTERLDAGVRTRDVLQLDVADRFRPRAIERLRQDARVATIASARWAPLDGGWWVIDLRNALGQSEGTNSNFVSPEYFSAVGVRLMSGRTFTPDEAAARAPVVVVSEAAARRFWPGADAVGQTLMLTTNENSEALFGAFRSATVIGVVRNAMPGTVMRPMTWPTAYYPQRLDARGSRLLARTRGAADAAQSSIMANLASLDAAGIEEVHSLASSFELQVYPFRAAYWLATAVGCIALLLTITGVYGVMSYLITQRRKELGIRMALGAGAASVVAFVLRQSVRMSLLGLAAGVVIALGISGVMRGSLLIANAFDVRGYAAGVVVVMAACLVAAYIPSRRAAAIDPAETLR